MTEEIDRLTATIAKLETAHGQNMREIDALRAELAAANEEKRQALIDANELLLDVKNAEAKVNDYKAALKVVEAERDTLRTELAAEREAQRAGMRALGAAEDYNAELREALREARLRLDDQGLEELAATIDALLKKGGGDE